MSAPTLPSPLELIEMDVNHAKGKAFNMLFAVWRYETTTAAYRQLSDLANELVLVYPEGVGISHIVEAEAIAPSAETRAVFVEFLRLPCLKHFGVTHEATGFKAAGVRAIISAQHALARPRCEHGVHNDIASAARWHEAQQRQLARQENAAKIADCLHRLRAMHRQKFGA
jgi:hypothetical protein